MKILVAGATGVVGRSLVPQLVAAGHEVSGTTRRREKAVLLEELGAHPVVVDVLDSRRLRKAVKAEKPDVVIHQLTDLSAEDFAANGLLRIDGTRNLVEAARSARVETMIAQSIAWLYVKGEEPAVETDPLDGTLAPYKGVAALEEAVADMPRGVLLRYGALYGPGTWYAPGGAIAKRVQAGELEHLAGMDLVRPCRRRRLRGRRGARLGVGGRQHRRRRARHRQQVAAAVRRGARRP